MSPEPVADTVALLVNAAGTMLHTAQCPHLEPTGRAALRPATEDDLATLPTCRACQAILDGWRRQEFTSLDDALEAFQAPLANRPRLRQVAATLPWTTLWIPASNPYIALGGPDGIAVAYFSKGFIEIHRPDGGYDKELLPVHGTTGSSTTAARTSEPEPVICPTCYTALPATGICDTCD